MRSKRPFSLRPLLPLALLAGAAAPALAQEAPPSLELRLAAYDSGPVENTGSRSAVVISRTVRVEGADWLRLAFQAVHLAGDPEQGTGAILRITSFADGAVQELDALELGQWQYTTAYFNGDTVQVDIEAQPGTGTSRLVLGRAWAGLAPGGTKSQCGPQDNRVPSTDPRSARALPVGCTAWIFDDCMHCMGSAGHCAGSSFSVMEFNVPFSSSNGSLNHPGPEDQYVVDATSKQSQYTVIGNDWAYFGVFPNSNTGLLPHQAQGAFYELRSPPAFNPNQEIRITGYGTDSSPSSYNQVQQTHKGPWTLFSGTRLQYQADTTGGNSGSPVIHETSGQVIGVHTNAGCQTSGAGSNSGTAANNAGWKNALANPKGVCNPVGSSSVYCTAKLNSQFCVPTISAVGTPSVSGGPGSFLVQSILQVNKQNGLLFYGTAPASTPFQGGFLCAGGAVKRTPLQNSGGNSGPLDCSGAYSFDMGALIASGGDPNLVCGAIVYCQFWGRDTGQVLTDKTSLTQGLKFTIGL